MDSDSPFSSTRWTRFTWLCAASPLFVLLLFVTMALHVRLGYGRWPQDAIDDFPALHFRLHEWMFLEAILFSVFAPMPLLGALIWHRRLGMRLQQFILRILVYVTGWVATFAILATVPARFVTWYLD